MITIGLCQLPGKWFPAPPSASLLSLLFLCVLPPCAEEDGGQAADSHDRWCMCARVCLFSNSFFPTEESQPSTINTVLLSIAIHLI